MPTNENHPADDDEVYILEGHVMLGYTRAMAHLDGMLIDVSELGREAGFKRPVSLTRAAWEDCVAWSAEDTRRKGWPQDETGRLWDVLWMAYMAARRAANTAKDNAPAIVRYDIIRVPRHGRTRKAVEVELILYFSPGDNGEPVFTIALAD